MAWTRVGCGPVWSVARRLRLLSGAGFARSPPALPLLGQPCVCLYVWVVMIRHCHLPANCVSHGYTFYDLPVYVLSENTRYITHLCLTQVVVMRDQGDIEVTLSRICKRWTLSEDSSTRRIKPTRRKRFAISKHKWQTAENLLRFNFQNYR